MDEADRIGQVDELLGHRGIADDAAWDPCRAATRRRGSWKYWRRIMVMPIRSLPA